MKFAYPEVLLLEFLVPLLAMLFVWAQQRRRKHMLQFGDLEILDRLSSVSINRRTARAGIQLAGLAILMVAVARPKFGTRLEEISKKGLDLVVALDVSQSMLTQDVHPNRLEKAKAEVGSLIERLSGDRIGLVAFAGTAFVQCPLTLDYSAARLFLDMIDTDSIPSPGTDIATCLRTALNSFTAEATKYRVVILITDGEHHGDFPEQEIEEAIRKGVRVYCIGIGRTDGAPIPVTDETGSIVGYKQDRENKPVSSKLRVFTLQKIAALTEGRFYQATRGELELDSIFEDLESLEKQHFSSRRVEQLEDRYQWFLGLGFILIALGLSISEKKPEGKVWYGRFI